ncbi:hypothetical protein [Hymenobacter sp. DG25A]|uniref:hypothetical protein n=1 Tax=Hymenobacter sp. DG25A TaxID=1385663 RepID=UPI0006BD95F0|nr:hypothetical protein [Hymenobacter sp. DG25A]ALD19964.1 hypothetical protein AM218_00380 [Hymenobacter sp. DG25A]
MLAALLLPFFSLVAGWCAQPTPAALRDKTVRNDFETLVEAERTFAAYGQEHSVQNAFGKYLGNAFLLHKGQFMRGRDIYGQAPEEPGRLIWRPVFADIAASGDLGVTTGPWDFRPNTLADAPTRFGNFATIWRKTDSGSWEAVYDGGISHAAPAKPAAEQLRPVRYALKQESAPADTARRRAELAQVEADFASRAKKCLRQAYQPVLGPTQELRLLREGEQPFLNTAAWALAKTSTQALLLQPVKTEVSAAGDWGYSIGYIGQLPERGQFLHVWRRTDGQWKLTMEVLSLRVI